MPGQEDDRKTWVMLPDHARNGDAVRRARRHDNIDNQRADVGLPINQFEHAHIVPKWMDGIAALLQNSDIGVSKSVVVFDQEDVKGI